MSVGLVCSAIVAAGFGASAAAQASSHEHYQRADAGPRPGAPLRPIAESRQPHLQGLTKSVRAQQFVNQA
jgi:hypothetical protein